MKVTVFGGLEVQSQDIDLESQGMSRSEYISAGGQGEVWDILHSGGILIEAPTVVTPVGATPLVINEGESSDFSPAVFDGTEPLTLNTYYTVDGGAPVQVSDSGYTFNAPLDGLDKSVVFTQTATNSKGMASSSVELTVNRIPIAPYMIVAPNFDVSFGAVGVPLSFDIGEYGGDPTLVVSFTVIDTQNSIDYTSSASGDPLTITPTAATDTLVLTVTVENIVGTINVTDTINIEAAILINNGLSITDSEVLVMGDSQMMGLLYDVYDEDNGRPHHTWSQVFRSAYTGGFNGDGPAGGLPGVGRAAFMGPQYGSHYLWNTATGFPTGQNPHTDMSSFDAIVISERSEGHNPVGLLGSDFNIESGAEGSRIDLTGLWQVAQAAVAGGIQTIFLDQTRMPLWKAGGTYQTTGENPEWRSKSNSYVTHSRIRYDYLRYKLNQAGHTNVDVFVIPRAELSNLMYDGIINGTAPAPVLAALPSWLHLYTVDSAYPQYHNRHYYMFGALGVYAEWCLTYAVWFAQSPVGISNQCIYDGATYTVDADVAAWMQQLAWDLATSFDLCGLGEPMAEVRDWEPYTGQDLHQMFPTALSISVVDDPVLTTGGVPAANTDPVLSIAGLTPTGANNPVKGPLEVAFNDSPVSGTIQPTNPKCGIIMFSLDASTQTDGVTEYLVAFGASSDFTVGFVKDSVGSGTQLNISALGIYSLSVGIPLEWADGRPLVMIWTAYDMNDPNEGRSHQAVINPTSGSTFNFDKYRSGGDNRDWDLTTNRTTMELGGPANSGQTTQMEFYGMIVFNDKPRDTDLIRALAYMESQFGGPLWPSEAYS